MHGLKRIATASDLLNDLLASKMDFIEEQSTWHFEMRFEEALGEFSR